MESYKDLHERFVSGHNGTTLIEVAMVTSIPCASVLVRDTVSTFFLSGKVGRNLIFSQFLLDFFLLVFPNILSVTFLSDHIPSLLLSILLFGGTGFYLSSIQRVKLKESIAKNINLNEKKQFVTYFRSVVNMCAVIGILGVDFSMFPRRFAKTETFGFGVMDAGVGGFVVANAIVSPEARGKMVTRSFTSSVKKAVVSSLPLLVLGFARLISVKSVDYQEHVTEYGVHWNFFFTLAALKVLSTLVTAIVPASGLGLCGVVILHLHQFYLMMGGTEYIMNGLDGQGGRRGGIIDANREGIYSLPGYVAIYLFGVHLGRFVFIPRNNLVEWMWSAFHLAVMAFASGVTTFILHSRVQPVSRRLVNATYVCWIMNVCGLMLLLCLVGDIAFTYCKALGAYFKKRSRRDAQNQGDQSSKENLRTQESPSKAKDSPGVCLLDAISFNSLLFFLLANLMTGLVNMTVNTIHTPPVQTVIILCLYMISLCTVTVGLRLRNISTKFW